MCSKVACAKQHSGCASRRSSSTALASSAHLWADHFDGSVENIFDLQDRMTESVVGAISRQLEQAEIERAKRKPTNSFDAYDYFLRGLASAHRMTRESTSEALKLFAKAVELDPD